MKTIPKSYQVQPLKPGEPAEDRATCGDCGRSWDDGKVTGITPTPAGRCPFESWHGQRARRPVRKVKTPKAGQPFAVTQQIDAQLIADALCCGLEGGTGYWAQIDNEHGPDYHADKCEEITAGRGYLRILELAEGEETAKAYKLDRAALLRGVEIMARDYSRHFADMTASEGCDAETGDVLLQCALLGKIVYG